MCFQLGRPRLSKFKNLIAAVEDLDWAKMVDEMEDSNWYRQTTNRAQRLMDRVDKIYAIEGVPV
jgi:hypothetical protein